jgi:hypothetical protein
MKTKYDDFGQVVWQEPAKVKRRRKIIQFMQAYKLLGKALF